MISRYIHIVKAPILLLVVTGLTGCYSANPKDIQAFLKPYEVNVTAENYILQPPDEIEIRCSKVPELNMQNQRIRPDGKVSFEGLGEFEVAGKTPKEVAAMLEKKAIELYTLVGDQPIDVRIIVYASKVFYVLGQVNRPGPKVYTGRDSVLSSLAWAQPNPMAWEQRTQVIRPSVDKNVKPKIFAVNYKRMIVHGDTSKDVLLEEGDIIYVPPTIFAAVALKLEEVLRPIARAFSGAYMLESGPTGTSASIYGRRY